MTRKGFTLIELLVVIAIIGILATLVITQVAGAQVRARNSQAKSNVNEIGKAVELRRTNNNEDLYLNAAASTQLSGTTAGGSWTTLLNPSSGEPLIPVRISATPANSTAYTYIYSTNTNTSPGTAGSTDFCVSTNIRTTNGVQDGGFYIRNGTSVQKQYSGSGSDQTVTNSGGACS